jgi:osmotically inducible protein OsmC
MTSRASSTWTGSWKHGEGTISTTSDTVVTAPFSYSSRFEGTKGASPEELLAAAHAGCVNQALANNFDKKGLQAESIETSVEIDVEQSEAGSPKILRSRISVVARVPGCTNEIFLYSAERARLHCSISAILKCEITMEATLTP